MSAPSTLQVTFPNSILLGSMLVPGGMLFVNTNGIVTSTPAALDHQILIGHTGANPTLTSTPTFDSVGSTGNITAVQLVSTEPNSSGVPPLVVASSVVVLNLNSSLLEGKTWEAPAAIGGTTPAAVAATALTANTLVVATAGVPPANQNLTPATQAISALNVDWTKSNVFTKTLAANSTFTFSGQVDGQVILVALTNTASNYTVTWPSLKWPGNVAPVQTVGAHTDVYSFANIGGTIYGSVVQNY